MSVNITIGSNGLIGSEVAIQLKKRVNDKNLFLDKEHDVYTKQNIQINLNEVTEIATFINYVSKINIFDDKVNIVYLAAQDAKLGEQWDDFLDFDIKKWRDFSKINQEALLYFSSKIIKAYKEENKMNGLHFILFPSLYNYLGPDQKCYEGWPKVAKPFEYIGTKSLTRDLCNYINSTYMGINVRCNCVVPQLVTKNNDNVEQKLLAKTLSGRGTKASEIAKVTEFLIDSPENLIGQAIFVDGGWTKI
jgi:NADP-dependent 3-hydroxy acid dehydrogenase YdfG